MTEEDLRAALTTPEIADSLAMVEDAWAGVVQAAATEEHAPRLSRSRARDYLACLDLLTSIVVGRTGLPAEDIRGVIAAFVIDRYEARERRRLALD